MRYIEQTKQFIAQAKTLLGENAIEARVRENFTSYLRLMFPDGTKWVDEHIRHGEERVSLQRDGRNVSGFIDNCIANTAIEYEKNLGLQSVFDEGYRQVKEYCAAFVRNGVDINIIQGVLSDTVNWYVYVVEEDSSLKKNQYTEDNITLKLIDECHLLSASDDVAENFRRFLTKYLGREGGRTVSARSLAQDFGLTSKYAQDYLSSFDAYVKAEIERRPEYFDMLQKMWNSYTSIETVSYGYMETQESYIHEFYISILAKLLCANFIEKRALLSTDEELCLIAKGTFFENRQISNFAEYDYFGWLTEENILRLIPTLKAIQRDLGVYDFSASVQEDLFGSLMVQLANRSQRLLLGQELTPSWLAEKVVSQTIQLLPSGKCPQFVDMCCGSGSMIVATLKFMPEFIEGLDECGKTQVVMKAITGFDIDPLAVILAKINWIIAAQDLISFDQEVFIPIYHADSLFIQSPLSSSENRVRLSLHDKKIDVPAVLLDSKNWEMFDALLNLAYDCIHEELNQVVFRGIVANRFPDVVLNEDEKNVVAKFTYDLYKAIRELDLAGQNGIWSFVLKNTLRPSLVSAKFNGIVSNTPWLALSKLGDNPYKTALRKLGKKLRILPSGSSFLHVELASIFLVNSVARYLEDGGIFGCVLPHSILAGNHHAPFRMGTYSHAKKPVEMQPKLIWLLPTDTFKNKSVALFGMKCAFSEATEYSGMIINRDEADIPTTFHVRTSGGMTIWANETSDSERQDFSYYDFSQGADIMPRFLFFYDLTSSGNNYRINKISPSGSNAYFLKDMKIGKDYQPPLLTVGKQYFHKVLLSNILTPFMLSPAPLALLPIKQNEENEWKELKAEDLLVMPRATKTAFVSVANEYARVKGKKKTLFEAINIYGKLTNQSLEPDSYLVVYGAGGSKTCAAYTHIDSSNDFVIDQTLYYYNTMDESEAIYLVGMLNSQAIDEINAAYQTEGQFGRRHIHTLPATSIPPYNPNSSLHSEVVRLTKALMEQVQEHTPSFLLNPNEGPVSSRRSKINKIICTLSPYTEYEDVCRKAFITETI